VCVVRVKKGVGLSRNGQVIDLTVSVDRPVRICENTGADKVPRLDMRGSALAAAGVPNAVAASAASTSCLRIQDMSANTYAESLDLI
jgi:hypothetical protein